jgi:hypothetical protein
MGILNQNCDKCGQSLTVLRAGCPQCGLSVEGNIPLPRLARLPDDLLNFLELFILSGGSLKATGKAMGMSYPAMKARLEKCRSALSKLRDESENARLEILRAVERGELSVEKAIKRIEEIK